MIPGKGYSEDWTFFEHDIFNHNSEISETYEDCCSSSPLSSFLFFVFSVFSLNSDPSTINEAVSDLMMCRHPWRTPSCTPQHSTTQFFCRKARVVVLAVAYIICLSLSTLSHTHARARTARPDCDLHSIFIRRDLLPAHDRERSPPYDCSSPSPSSSVSRFSLWGACTRWESSGRCTDG